MWKRYYKIQSYSWIMNSRTWVIESLMTRGKFNDSSQRVIWLVYEFWWLESPSYPTRWEIWLYASQGITHWLADSWILTRCLAGHDSETQYLTSPKSWLGDSWVIKWITVWHFADSSHESAELFKILMTQDIQTHDSSWLASHLVILITRDKH